MYFNEGSMQYDYPGQNDEKSIIAFMKNPKQEVVEKPAEVSWSEEPSHVVHLTDDTFDDFLEEHNSVLIMFYAPWCGHCKKAKPHFVAAAFLLQQENIAGKVAAVDCTK